MIRRLIILLLIVGCGEKQEPKSGLLKNNSILTGEWRLAYEQVLGQVIPLNPKNYLSNRYNPNNVINTTFFGDDTSRESIPYKIVNKDNNTYIITYYNEKDTMTEQILYLQQDTLITKVNNDEYNRIYIRTK